MASSGNTTFVLRKNPFIIVSMPLLWLADAAVESRRPADP
jgi:hypothetical protein